MKKAMHRLMPFLLWAAFAAPAIPQSNPAVNSPASADTVHTAASQPAPADAPAIGLEFSIIKTSDAHTREMLVFSGGEFGKQVKLQHVAILVHHPKGTFLFDTGLGSAIDTQFAQDMPFWAKPFFNYGAVTPARAQLDAAKVAPIERIIISHGHWDHVSGLADFPQAEVWINGEEQEFLRTPHAAAVLPSQIKGPVKWVSYSFKDGPVGEFAHSLDLFGDGSAVLVPMPGHTPGSTGLFLKTGSGKEILLIGDTVWKQDAIEKQAPKFWLARKMADHDPEQTFDVVKMLARLQQARPNLLIVPAHDTRVHDLLAYFPAFVK